MVTEWLLSLTERLREIKPIPIVHESIPVYL